MGKIVYRKKPKGFFSDLVVVACYIFVGNRCLMVKRADSKKIGGGRWGVPAGKVEKNELFIDALVREIYEETTIALDKKSLKLMTSLFIATLCNYEFHMFTVEYSDFPKVSLNSENSDYRWVTLEEAFAMPLVEGGLEALQIAYERSVAK